jgi:serine/threonine-protein kinase
MDDTHPSYQMVSKPPEDTQPRVVLDDAALRGQSEEQVIISGVLEDSGISSPGRPKASRRPRASSGGMPSISRPPARGATRPVEPESPAQDDSGPVLIDIEDGGEEARDPRDDTRRTPLPTRPGENLRRPQRAAAAAPAPASARKRSWGWLVVSLVLLLVAGGAVVVALPQLEHLLKLGESGVPRLPPAVPIRPVPLPNGPPGTAPAATGPAPVAAVPAPVATAPPPAGAALADDDFFVPLPNAPSPPPPKKTPARPSKKVPRSKDAIELQKEWTQTRGFFQRLTQEQSCESTKLALPCSKYEDLKKDMSELGDAYDKDLQTRVKRLRKELQQLLLSSP